MTGPSSGRAQIDRLPPYEDVAKALVMRRIRELVADGFAEFDTRANGNIELRLPTGERFLLTETGLVRFA